MKRILVLTRFPNEYEPRRIKIEGEKLGFQVDVVNYKEVLEVVEKAKTGFDLGTGVDILSYDLIIPRSATNVGKKNLVDLKMKIFNDLAKSGVEMKVVNLRTFMKYPFLGKSEQGRMMMEAGLPTIPFLFFGISEKLGGGEKIKNWPVMVKGKYGSHGKRVRLVNGREEYDRTVEEVKGSILVQPVIRMNKWYRVLMGDGEVWGMVEHRQKRKYRIHKEVEEGKNVFTDKDLNRLKEICLEVCKLFECDYAGIDVGWDLDKNDWVVMEINRTAQFRSVEKIGVNVALNLVNL